MRANGLCRRIYLYAADGLGGVNGDRACPNVLPLAVNLHATEDLPTLAKRLAAQLKKMRRHQRYDAEQIVRDSGRAAGDTPLFGPVLNIKVFDYHLDLPGIQAHTHTRRRGRLTILNWRFFRMKTAVWILNCWRMRSVTMMSRSPAMPYD